MRRRYGDDPSQFGELFAPDGEGPFPVAVVIHGGFWKAEYGRKLMWPVCEDLVERGWAAWNLEYRRLGFGSGGGWPATCEDVAAGVRAVDGLPGVDAARRVVLGHSAGGHLALWAAAQPDLGLRAAVSQAGVADLVEGARLQLSNGVVQRFMGGEPGELPDAYAAASPAALVPLGVPSLCVHGTADDVVPPAVAESFVSAARAAGEDVTLAVFEGAGHMGHIEPPDPMWQATADWLEPWRTA